MRPSEILGSDRVRPWLALGLSMILAGCGNLTAGGATGETRVSVIGDGSGSSSSLSSAGTTPRALTTAARGEGGGLGSTSGIRASSLQRAEDEESDSDDEPEGEIELEFTIVLETIDGVSLPLTDNEVQIDIDIPGTVETEVVRRTVPSARYTSVGITFTEIEVQIDTGLVIDGRPVTGPVDVEMEEATLLVDRAVDFELGDGDRVEILVDMNAAAWLAAVDPDTQSVDDDVVSDLIRIVIR